MPLVHYLPLILLLMAGAFFSVKAQKLTLGGAITGVIVALMVFTGAEYTGLYMLTAFFILGTLATQWKKNEKQLFKAVEDRSSKRTAGQVLANGSVAGITGILIFFFPAKTELFALMMAASLASATADTLSSELGMVYGRRFYNIITLKSDKRGLDGVISIEGTLIGIAGAMLMAIIYSLGFDWGKVTLFILIAGTIGNFSDSVLGALLERKHYIGNDAVNFLNTTIAALAAWLCVALL
jgi:uncharacterized protein (TIGR00297 family)